MFKKIAGCVLVCLILWMIYIVFHSPGSVTKFAPQRISEVCGVSGTKLIYLVDYAKMFRCYITPCIYENF